MSKNTVISKEIMQTISSTIEKIWVSNIAKDYNKCFILMEDSLKCCFYYHLRRKLASFLKKNNLCIYTEYYITELGYRADIAIVKVDPECAASHLKDRVTHVIAIIELKYAGGNSKSVETWIKSDVKKLKNYVQSGTQCKCFFAVVYETECECLNWLDKRSTKNWAAGTVTELDAGYIDGKMRFEVHPY